MNDNPNPDNLGDIEATDEFEIVQVEGNESKFSDLLEFAKKRRYGSDIVNYLREHFGVNESTVPVIGKDGPDLVNYYSTEFDDQADDGQAFFNVYAPPNRLDSFRVSDLEKVFSELSLFGESSPKFSTRFLIISFTEANGITPVRMDMTILKPELSLAHQNSVQKRMQAIAGTGASKILAIKLQKPKV